MLLRASTSRGSSLLNEEEGFEKLKATEENLQSPEIHASK